MESVFGGEQVHRWVSTQLVQVTDNFVDEQIRESEESAGFLFLFQLFSVNSTDVCETSKALIKLQLQLIDTVKVLLFLSCFVFQFFKNSVFIVPIMNAYMFFIVVDMQ